MIDLIPGQRCISDAELQLGLGTVLKAETRTVTVLYLATGDTRNYARHSAPLTRVIFNPGDRIRDHEGIEITVTAVSDHDGLLTYEGKDGNGVQHTIREAELDNHLQLNNPGERLFNGQVDNDKWFRLRYQTLEHRNRLTGQQLHGLTGCRTSLIAHQLYIAHEVALRHAPRVLLADEVGLGKTIEAGLILHHQLLTQRARRVLILVPETLLHQWLVEMLRRFNLHFRIFDRQRCDELRDSGDYDNIFDAEQLVLCSIDHLRDDAGSFDDCRNADWDLMVVDEAHHLEWSETDPSIEYRIVEQLSQQTRGVLLLTATPEQLGKASHFARLRLLDVDRFPDFNRFIEEEANYAPYARLIEGLLEQQQLSDDMNELLRGTLDEDDNQRLVDILEDSSLDDAQREVARQQLIDHLLDRHGTGRVLFRNTRSAVQGFPERRLHPYPLPPAGTDLPVHDDDGVLASHLPMSADGQASAAPIWLQDDPRIEWLISTCAELLPHKVLVITASAQTALDIVSWLKLHSGLHATAFHEGLSIVERDRAAAFFADTETGSQVLVCSEIGSEGRNFQFAHHLVLFDLPLNPDLLEQRIGRLDRIGQRSTIHIHVPYLENTAHHALFRWYHEALDSFEHTCPAGHAVFERHHHQLSRVLAAMPDDDELSALIEATRATHQQLVTALSRGRDRLLEYNSCRPHVAQHLVELAANADNHRLIQDYMEQVYDCFGVDAELHSEDCYVLTPTEQMISRFPGIPDDGVTVTYRRDVALSFEDAQFISWEHPMVDAAMEMVLTREHGNTSVIAVSDLAGEQVPPAGSILLECLFSLEASAIESLHADRYLPPTMIRVLCDERGRDLARLHHHDELNAAAKQVGKAVAVKVVSARRKLLKAMLQRCEAFARKQSAAIIDRAHSKSHTSIINEINRLETLSKVNPNIRAEEIRHFQDQLSSLDELISNAGLRIDAIRVIVVT